MENQLKVLHQKKDYLYSYISEVHDLSKRIKNPNDQSLFKRKVLLVDANRSEYSSLLDKINQIELDLDLQRPTGYVLLETVDVMCATIKYAEQFLNKPSSTQTSPNKSGNSSGNMDQNSNISLIKLQRLELPTFSGNINEWPLFHNLFKVNVHERPDIPKSHKLQHLLSKLSGRALSVCAGILPTDENYDVIWENLVSKYEDKRQLATHYMDTLFQFKAQKVESSQSLSLFVDKFGSTVAALQALDIPDLQEFILFYIGNLKLDDQTRRMFETSLKQNELPTFSKLLKFVDNQSKILSRIQPNCSSSPTYNKSSGFTNNRSAIINSNSNNKQSHTFLVENISCCLMCKMDHPLFKCSSFLKLNPQDRYSFVKQHALCVNCLRGKHRVSDCKSNNVCNNCRLRHHSLLHFTKKTEKYSSDKILSQIHNITASSDSQDCQESQVQSLDTIGIQSNVYSCYQSAEDKLPHSNGSSTVLLGTVKVNVFDVHGVPKQLRFLLDNGSMSNILTKDALNVLQYPLNPSNANLSGLGANSSHVHGQVNFTFASRFDDRMKFSIQALVVDHIVDKLPTLPIDCSKLSYLMSLSLADDSFMSPGPIAGILGSSVYPYVLLGTLASGKVDQPVAINTKLGHVVIGNAPVQISVGNIQNNHNSKKFCMFQNSSFDNQLQRFWELESVPPLTNEEKLSADDQACEKIYSSQVSRSSNGKYVVPLPFKEDPSQLGDSFLSAKKRFLSLEKKLNSSPELYSKYSQAVSDLIDKDFISECSDQSDISGYFLPHRAVEKPDRISSKIRIVYDAGAKASSGLSLNDLLYSGPKLYTNLFRVLLNFRLFPYALNGDITKMFLQIKVHKQYWKYQKLIWRFSSDEPLKFYNLMVVVFGIKPSPYLALRTVQQLVSDEAENYPIASQNILNKLYMDDCVASFLTEDETISFYREVTDMFQSGGFTFTKWSSNSSNVLAVIPLANRLANMISWDKDDLTLKVLGMHWNATSDELFFKINPHVGACTKRGMLSYILSIYDPLGLIAPVVVCVKLLIKELWLSHIDWDSTPPTHVVETWNLLMSQLPTLQDLSFPRHIGVGVGCIFQLLGFSDASQKAYGAQIFSRVLLPNGEIHVRLVTSKSKVSPVKVESICRLELCSILLLSELMKVVIDSYSGKYDINKVYYFTDSSVALCWSHSSPHLFNVFVANRVSKIQKNLDVSNLFHIMGTENPADGLSRGLLPEQLPTSLFLSGPSWLQEPEVSWPIRSYSDFTNREMPEVKSSVTLLNLESQNNTLLEMFSRCSRWLKLLNVMVYILRFLKKAPINQRISADDLNSAEIYVVKVLQSYFFSEDIEKIKNNLVCSPSLKKLCPFLDENGILRVGGRICNSDLSFAQQHPILLSAKHHAIGLIVDHLHIKNFHTGPHLLMSLLRQKFWVLGARNLVRKRFQACNICFRHSPKFIYPLMGDLPKSRVLESKPFLNTACDYLGPIPVVLQHRRGQKPQKSYVCLFICLATKAVHLEVTLNLSSESFLNAFKRFLSRRGPVKTMLSDNGTNFVGAKNHLNEIYGLLDSDEYKDRFARELAEHRITWKFNPPGSPHFGGIFESNVKSFKNHFNKIIFNHLLSLDEMVTLTTQIECLLNSRPLCKLNSDPEDCDILTPNHFLKITPLSVIPALDFSNDNINRLTRFQLLDRLMQSFWKRWSLEYLTQLQAREKWSSHSPPIKPGMLVLMRQENAAPLNWPTGIVSEVYPGNDGIVRVALVRTPRGEFRRAVCNLCPLPTQ